MAGRKKSGERHDRAKPLPVIRKQAHILEFELAVWQLFSAFNRWQADCIGCVSAAQLSGPDTAALFLIRLKESPMGISEIARLLNRDDYSNIQYSVKKLLKAGLIEKAASASKKQTTYRISELGREITDRSAVIREKVLLSMYERLANVDQELVHITKMLDLITGVYDQASRTAITYADVHRHAALTGQK